MPVEKFTVDIPQARIDDLHRRLDDVHLPHDYANDDWTYGVPRAYLEELVQYWRNDFDWRAREREINTRAHFKTEVDGLPVHFIHERGKGPNPVPLILSHGWPWTFWDLWQVIGPLTDPASYGGDPADSFDVVIPSLPGFVFSTPVDRVGVNWSSTADMWAKLMREQLGYDRFAAQGGDWGAMITTQIGHRYAEHLIGIHLTNAFPVPAFGGERPWSITDAGGVLSEDPADRARVLAHQRKFASHLATHMLHPQTLAYAMHDSPVGLLAWMAEKRRSWGDCRGDLESRFPREDLLTHISLYWLTDSFSTSVRYYAEAARVDWKPDREGMPQVPVPTGLSLFEHDQTPGPMDWAKEYYDLRLLERREDGGHFGPSENPSAVVDDLRTLFRPLR